MRGLVIGLISGICGFVVAALIWAPLGFFDGATSGPNTAEVISPPTIEAPEAGGDPIAAAGEPAAATATVESANPENPANEWKIRRERSPIDDSQVVVLSVLASDPETGSYGREIYAGLIVQCYENSTDIVITSEEFLGSDRLEVVTRLDDGAAETKRWAISTDHKGAFHPNPIAFAKRMLTAERLIVRYIPYGESARTFSYPIAGLGKLLPEVAAACNWTM